MDAQEIKQLKELQDAYLSVYEAKKVDQDEDGDIARLVASGMSKAEAIVAVKNKEYNEGYKPWDFGPKDKAKAKYDKLAARKKAGGSAPGTATRANKIASVGREMRTTLDKDSAMTMTNPKKQGLQPSTPRHTAAAIRGAGGGMTARTKFRKEEFELWVNDLIGEGYDLSDYTWDEMYESYLDEGLGSAIKRIFSGKKEAEALNNSYDLFDAILEHLIVEGYADTNENALVIMANMSEDWREDIVEKTAMAKRGHDETAIRNKIAKSTGGGEAADRAGELADRKTFGQRGVDPKARQNLARAQRGDFRKTTSSSPGLKGYAYKATTDSDKAKQAARGAQRGALTPKEKKQFGR